MPLSHTRASDYALWYQDVVAAADMAENSIARGCMVFKPWGYGLWEQTRDALDKMIKDTGHENCYFPLFIPLSLFQKEADHVEGFAKEMAIVTHSRLEKNSDGKLVPASPLEEPYIVRPTSEMIIAESFSKWIQSYRDLPVLINQWANVVRWEMRPRLFLRTCEFLWQEGHTAHATRQEAEEETLKMLECYRQLSEDFMAMPVITGRKPAHERFPGAVDTYCIEAMMQDGRALQAGTSHYLGQNFAKSSNIRFQSAEGKQEYAYTTSWGASTRLIGGLIMTHGDDEGLKVPPKLAPYQAVIVPLYRDDNNAYVDAYCREIEEDLKKHGVRVKFDTRLKESIDKRWEWIRKGAPLVLEIGQKDLEKKSVAINIRNKLDQKKVFMDKNAFLKDVRVLLDTMQQEMFEAARTLLESRTVRLTTKEEFMAFFKDKNSVTKGGFVLAKWSGDESTLEMLKEMNVTVRCIPLNQSGTKGKCILTGKPATDDVIFARAY